MVLRLNTYTEDKVSNHEHYASKISRVNNTVLPADAKLLIVPNTGGPDLRPFM